ncbi:MAG: hypothetical protein Q4G28_12345, partial [Neisseria sp.]|nr:hypothetical protein [Neisseria sp.]
MAKQLTHAALPRLGSKKTPGFCYRSTKPARSILLYCLWFAALYEKCVAQLGLPDNSIYGCFLPLKTH